MHCFVERWSPSDIKPRLLGHWGTTPGINLVYAHLNRMIVERDLSMLLITGPGHGGPALTANTWLEGSFADVYPTGGLATPDLMHCTDEFCGYGQSGPVVFLMSLSADYPTCIVAQGAAIYLSVATPFCSTVEPPPFFGRTEDELRACATDFVDGVTEYEARINGQDVADLDAYRTASPMFTITFPEDNVIGVEPGVANAVSEGYSVIIAPPPPGEYEIEWSAQFPTDTERRPPSTVNLVVEAAQVIEPTTT